MKRIFSVMAAALFVVGASAQSFYQMNVISNDGTPIAVFDASRVSVTFSEKPAKQLVPEAGTDLSKINYSEAIARQIVLNLEKGKEYTISEDLVVPTGCSLTVYGNGATVKFTGDASFVLTRGISLNDVTIDASGSSKALIAMSEAPDETTKGAVNNSNMYNILSPLSINNSTINGLKAQIITDNGKAYAPASFTINNSIINLATEGSVNSALIAFPTAGIKDLKINNSTIAQKGEGGFTYFIQYNNNNSRIDRLGYDKEIDKTTVTLINNTFYKANTGNFANYGGLANYSTYEIKNNIFFECGAQVARRLLGNGRLGSGATATWAGNTYWKNGAIEGSAGYDDNALTTDPALVDPENGNFQTTGAEQIAANAGDTRYNTVHIPAVVGEEATYEVILLPDVLTQKPKSGSMKYAINNVLYPWISYTNPTSTVDDGTTEVQTSNRWTNANPSNGVIGEWLQVTGANGSVLSPVVSPTWGKTINFRVAKTAKFKVYATGSASGSAGDGNYVTITATADGEEAATFTSEDEVYGKGTASAVLEVELDPAKTYTIVVSSTLKDTQITGINLTPAAK